MKRFVQFALVLLLGCVSSRAAILTICASGCTYTPTQLQAALDAANPGDIITIDPATGASTTNGLILRNKTNPSGIPVIIRSAALFNLPPKTRVSHTNTNLAVITYTSPGAARVVYCDQGAAYYRFEGIKFQAFSGDYLYIMIWLSTPKGVFDSDFNNQISQLPHDIVFDRDAFVAPVSPTGGSVLKAINANTGKLTVMNCDFFEIKDVTQDTQDIAGTNAMGPFYFRNNHFEAVGEETMFGGAVGTISGLHAEDLAFIGNEYYKPWVWRFAWNNSDPGNNGGLYDARGGEWYANSAGGGIGTGLFNFSNTGVYPVSTPLTWIQDGTGGVVNGVGVFNPAITFPGGQGGYQSMTNWVDAVYCPTSGCASTNTMYSPSLVIPSFEYVSNSTSVEMGVGFQSSASGYIKGIRFFKNAADTGGMNGTLWSSTGTQLATASYAGSSAAGWVEVDFGSPVAITANTVYYASWHTGGGFYSQWSFFRQPGMTDGIWQSATEAQILNNYSIQSPNSSGSVNPTGACTTGNTYKNTVTPSYWLCVSSAWSQITLGQWLVTTAPNGGRMLNDYDNKNVFEMKNGQRVLVEGNYLHNDWSPTKQGQHGAAFLFNLVDGNDQSNNNPWPANDFAATLSDITLKDNIIKDVPWGVSNGVQLDNGSALTYYHMMDRVKIEDNVFNFGNNPESLWDFSGNAAGGSATFTQTSNQSKLAYVHNTIVSMNPSTGTLVDMYDPSLSKFPNQDPQVTFSANVVSWMRFGFYAEDGHGALWNAFDNTWGANRALSKSAVVDSQATGGVPNNIFHPSDTSGLEGCPTCANPAPASFGAIGFANLAGGYGDNPNTDYTLSGTYAGAWGHARPAGANIAEVNWSTAHDLDGLPNPYLDFKVRTLAPAQTTASMLYTAYDPTACTLTVSARPDLSSPVFTNTDAGGNIDRLVSITGLSANNRYFYSLSCTTSTYLRTGQFLTTP